MAVPRQVQAQAERADQLIAEMQGNPTPANDPAQPSPTPEPQQDPQASTNQDPAHAPQPPATPEPAKDERNDWKAKYLVLKGKYDSEVPRMSAEIRDLKGQLGNLQQQITTLKSNPAPDVNSGNTVASLNDIDLDPDMRAAIERVIEQRVSATTQPLQQQVRDLGQTEQDRNWNRFTGAVASEIPDYEAIDASPDFQAWVTDLDSFSGKSRADLLNEAIESMAAGRVIAIYRAFRAEQGAPAPQPQGVVQPVPLANQVVPAPSGSSAPPPAQPKMISRKEVADFYADVTKGLYRGRETEAKQRQAEIEQAYREGRVN